VSRKPRKRTRKPSQDRLLFEELEPRVLLSANLEGLFIEEQLGCTITVSTELEGLDLNHNAGEEGGPVETVARRELVVIDTATPDYQALLEDIQAGTEDRQFEVVLIRQDEDGIARLGEILDQYSDLDAVHLISPDPAGFRSTSSLLSRCRHTQVSVKGGDGGMARRPAVKRAGNRARLGPESGKSPPKTLFHPYRYDRCDSADVRCVKRFKLRTSRITIGSVFQYLTYES
jgi:hypothetical protein